MGYLGNQITTVFPSSISVDTATIATANISNQLTDANMSSGSVIQTVTAETSTQVSITSETFTDSGLTASITPTSSSNKIVIYTNQFVYTERSASSMLSGIRLMRDSSLINQGYGTSSYPLTPYQEIVGSSANYASFVHSIIFVDSPSTTSSITYKTQGAVGTTANSSNITFQKSSNVTNKSTIILQEIQS